MPAALSQNPRLRLFTLCALYLAQGIPWGFVTITLAAWLAAQGLSVAEIGQVIAMSMLPWAFKWVFGPLIDRFGLPAMGRRRPWILLAQFGMALSIFAMLWVDNIAAQLGLLQALVFIHNIFNALQDVAVDALATDLLDEAERGRANGLMYGSKFLGGAVGGAGLSFIITHGGGLQSALILEVALLGAVFLLPLLLREHPQDRLFPWSKPAPRASDSPRPIPSLAALFSNLWRAFTLRSTLLGLLLALGIELGAGVLGAVAPVLMVQELGWQQDAYAGLVGGWGLAMGLIGASIGGFLADAVGHRRLAAIASVLLGTTWIVFGLGTTLWHSPAFVTVNILADRLFISVLAVSLFALYMDLSWPRVAATQFTAYMAVLNLSATLGADLAGPLQSRFGAAGTYIFVGLVQAFVIVLLRFIDPHQTRRVLGTA